MTIRGEALKGHLDLILLSTLERGPAYGYLLVSAIGQDTEGRLSISDGTIYPALHRLERAGLLTSFSEVTAGRRRRIYKLTADGKLETEKLKAEWDTLTGGVQKVLEKTSATKASRTQRGA